MDSKTMMRRRISAYDFSIWELGIYLDTHTQDTRALKKRQAYQAEREALVKDYEKQYGPYIVNSNQVAGDRWTWVDNPWPWDYVKED